jgi:AcrR family transcriptional regulator
MPRPGPAASDAGGAAPERSTRERILDIALELFVEQGYDKTSLRDIATRLGTTKAALYYHFERKQDILLELHLRLHALVRDTLESLERVEDGRQRADAWPALLDRLIDQVIENRELVLLHQRNPSAFEHILGDERNQAENGDFLQQFRRILDSPAIPLEQRVRIVCSVSAVVGVLGSSAQLFGAVPMPELADHVRDAVRELLRAPAASR